MEQLLKNVQVALDELKAASSPAKDSVREAVENVLTSEGWTRPAVTVPVVAEPSEVETPVEAGSAEDTNEVSEGQ